MNKREPQEIKFAYNTHFKAYPDNKPKLTTTIIGKFPPMNMMTEQPSQVSLPIENVGSEHSQ